MRKHDVRKWLHAILDLLPVILIPVFMIYSHRHEINNGSLVVAQSRVVDFNQILKNNSNFDTIDYWRGSQCDVSVENDNLLCVHNTSINSFSCFQQLNNFVQEDYYYCSYSVYIPSTYTSINRVRLNFYQTSINESFINVPYYNQWFTNSVIVKGHYINSASVTNFEVVFNASNGNLDSGAFAYFQFGNMINLTQMFGSGNEPTLQEFNSWYEIKPYNYTLSHKELLHNYSTITYNDTDIMSQFTYQLYNSVDKYFNVGNVFHLGEVYDWFNLNIFNGQAPLYIFVVYQIVLYELVMDLLFLLYGLFMWFIDMIQKLMEKPLNSIK